MDAERLSLNEAIRTNRVDEYADQQETQGLHPEEAAIYRRVADFMREKPLPPFDAPDEG